MADIFDSEFVEKLRYDKDIKGIVTDPLNDKEEHQQSFKPGIFYEF